MYFKLDINIDRYIHNMMHVDHDILFGTSYTSLHSKISIYDIQFLVILLNAMAYDCLALAPFLTQLFDL